MISVRLCIPVVAGVLLAASSDARVKKGVGMPGEILFSTPSLSATWQDYREKFALISLVDTRTDEPLLISQNPFEILLSIDYMLRASEFDAGSASISQIRPKPEAPTMEEQIGGRRAAVTLVNSASGITAKWSVLQPEGADFFIQTVKLSAAKDISFKELHLIVLQLDGAKAEKVAGGAGVVTDTMFFGIMHPRASSTIDGAKVHCLIKENVTIGPGRDFEISSVLGAAPQGKATAALAAAMKGRSFSEQAGAAGVKAHTPPKPIYNFPKNVKPDMPVPAGGVTRSASKQAAPAPKPVYKFPANVNANTLVPGD